MIKRGVTVLALLMLLTGCGDKTSGQADNSGGEGFASKLQTAAEEIEEEQKDDDSGKSEDSGKNDDSGKNVDSGKSDDSGDKETKRKTNKAPEFEQAADFLTGNEYMSGFATSGLTMLDEGTEVIDGKECRLIGIGRDHDGKLTVENHFAVSIDQTFYKMDVIDGSWKLLDAEVEFASSKDTTGDTTGTEDSSSSNDKADAGKDKDTAGSKDSKETGNDTSDGKDAKDADKDTADSSDSKESGKDAADSEAAEGEAVPLDSETQYEANIFLSNFAEQTAYFNYDSDSDLNDMVDFIYIYAIINADHRISLEGGYFTLEGDWIIDNLKRFFDVDVSLSELEDGYRSNDFGHFENGKFYSPAATGESYNRIAVVDSMTRDDSGLYRMNFSVFEFDINEYNSNGIEEGYYYLTYEEAEAHSKLRKVADGQAIVSPLERNGHHTYVLHEYTIEN